MELFGITEAVKQIEKAYFKNDDIKFPLYGFYFNMVKELDLIAAIAKHDTIDLHSMWDPVVKKLTARMEEKPQRRKVLDDSQIARLQPVVKLYTCMFNRKLNCILGISTQVSQIEERVFFNSQAQDILYEFLMSWVDVLGLDSALRKIEERDIYSICDTFTEKVEAQLRSINKLDDETVKECERFSRRTLSTHCIPENKTGKAKECDQFNSATMKSTYDRYMETQNAPLK